MSAARLSRISSSFSRYNPWISRSIPRHVKIHSAASQNPSLAFQHRLQGQRSKQIYSRILKSPHDIHETTSIHGLHPVRHWGFDPWLSSRASIHGLHPGLHPWPLYLWLPAMASIHGPMRGFHPWDPSMASIDPFHVFHCHDLVHIAASIPGPHLWHFMGPTSFHSSIHGMHPRTLSCKRWFKLT